MSSNTFPTADSATIEVWCREAAGGDHGALEKLLWSYHERLLSFTRRKIGPDWHGKIDPEDILQEAYIEVFTKIADFAYRGEDSFYHWASWIINHRFIDQVRHWRRQKRDPARELTPPGRQASSYDTLLERCRAEVTTPSVALRRSDARNALMTCIAKLPDDYRTVVRRLYLNQEPLAAIATDLDRSEDAVRRLGSRALQRLTRCLGRASRYLSSRG